MQPEPGQCRIQGNLQVTFGRAELGWVLPAKAPSTAVSFGNALTGHYRVPDRSKRSQQSPAFKHSLNWPEMTVAGLITDYRYLLR